MTVKQAYQSRSNNIVSNYNSEYVLKQGIPSKITSEYFWYKSMQQHFRAINFLPNVQLKSKKSYLLEAIEGHRMDEIFRSEISDEQRKKLLANILTLRNRYTIYQNEKKAYDKAQYVYIQTFMSRLHDWDEFRCVQNKKISVDQVLIPSFLELKVEILKMANEVITSVNKYWGIIHGDLNFTNIIFNREKIFLIDPRGSFGGQDSIFGDVRYDIAKLRQCYAGNYDLLASNSFIFSKLANYKFEYIFKYSLDFQLIQELDYIVGEGYSLRDLKIIEMIQFFSMIPLHNENAQRQILLYVQAMKYAHELLGNDVSHWCNYNDDAHIIEFLE